ncbi:MAG TPA: CBS domain-containing protein [Nannocystis sp.]
MHTVEELMSRPVYTCTHDETLHTAARRMFERDCGALPVVDHEGRLIGIVTDRDMCMAAYTQRRLLSEIPVSMAMSTRVFTCRPTDTIDTAEHIMRQRRVRRVPVVDADHHPVGMLSLDDLARDAARRQQRDVEHAFVHTMATICERLSA